MRRTPTSPAKAARSANSRLEANQAALREAWEQDVKEGPDFKQRHQWRAATNWLRSEVTALSDADRQALLAHLIETCQTANVQARKTVVTGDRVT